MAPEVADITLVPLNDAEYAEFAELQIVENARQHINAGEWTAEEAVSRAREGLEGLLADTLRGAGDVFLKGVDVDGRRVGWVWVAPAPTAIAVARSGLTAFLGEDREHKRWLSQITIEEARRERGYGRALSVALHRWLDAQGVEELWLRVYNWNDAARRLYTWAGYEVMRQFPTDAHLRRRLVPRLSEVGAEANYLP